MTLLVSRVTPCRQRGVRKTVCGDVMDLDARVIVDLNQELWTIVGTFLRRDAM
jgi:hypothetical protein